eukprot:14420016-Heterocapsa_arctica.AAC.1
MTHGHRTEETHEGRRRRGAGRGRRRGRSAMTRRDLWGHKGSRQKCGSSSLEDAGSVHITQPLRVPEEAGFWATQVPPPGTGSAHEQYPGGSYRGKARKREPARIASRKPGAATACDRASPGPGKCAKQEQPAGGRPEQGARAGQDRRVRHRRQG